MQTPQPANFQQKTSKEMIRFLLLFFCLASLPPVFSQECPNECQKNFLIFFKVNEVSKQAINQIDANENIEKIWRKLEEVRDSKDPFDKVYNGVGCFFFYFAYAKLAGLVEKKTGFRRFLEEDMKRDVSIVKKEGYIAAGYALDILDIYRNDGDCKKEYEKIYSGVWERELKALQETLDPASSPMPDIALSEFYIIPESLNRGETAEIRIFIKNSGDKDINTTFSITWVPFKGHKGISKQVHPLKVSEDTTILFQYPYYELGKHTSSVFVDDKDQVKESDETNNFLTKTVTVRLNEPPPPPTVKNEECTLKVIGNHQEDKNTPPEIVITFDGEIDECRCITYFYEFPPGIIQTYSSEKMDDRFFEKSLYPFLEEQGLSLKTANIVITGFADSIPFGDKKNRPLPPGMTEVPGGRYYKQSNKKKMTPMKPFNEITNNLQLAYTRAVYVKTKIIRIFNLEEGDITIHTHTNQLEEGSRWRGAKLEICWNSNSGIDLNQFKELLDSTLKEEPMYVPEEKPQKKEPLRNPKNFSDISKDDLHEDAIFRIDKLFFEADSTKIKKSSYQILDKIYEFLSENPGVIIEVGGHTNNLPPPEYCDSLSQKRARGVATYLIQRGISRERISYKGYGKRKPIADNNTEEGRRRNQRVEIKILSIDE